MKHDKTIQRILLSTTSRLTGAFDSEVLCIDHAWPPLHDPHRHRDEDGPTSRAAFVLSFRTAPFEPRVGVSFPDYAPFGDYTASVLSLLFGKRFESHGSLVNLGFFGMPDVAAFSTTSSPGKPYNTHVPRKDFAIALELDEVRRIISLLTSEPMANEAAGDAFATACRFYQRALLAADRDPEIAYLHLITAGEVVAAAHIPPSDAKLLDVGLEADLQRISEAMEDGAGLARRLRKRLFEVKRRYVTTFVDLVDGAFFEGSEAEGWGRLEPRTFEDAMKAAYDLRSRNVHRGDRIGGWVRSLHRNNEVQLGSPVVSDMALKKVLEGAPTLVGLERTTRYMLLKFGAKYLGIDVSPTSQPIA